MTNKVSIHDVQVGDTGQRFEVRFVDGAGEDRCVGWADNRSGVNALLAIVSAHPVWHDGRVVDRKPVVIGQFSVIWLDHGREPQHPPNPDYPHGIHIELAKGTDAKFCTAEVPYPAKRCGLYIVRCSKCKAACGISTAGRPDDPRSLQVPCLNTIH